MINLFTRFLKWLVILLEMKLFSHLIMLVLDMKILMYAWNLDTEILDLTLAFIFLLQDLIYQIPSNATL